MTATLFSGSCPTTFPSRFGPATFRPSFGEIPSVGEIEVRLGNHGPAHAVYVRRRLVAGLLALGLLTAFGVSARAVLADRGGVPASTPAIRPANIDAGSGASAPAATGQPPAIQRIVQPGDTLWGLAETFHGRRGVAEYVDALVAANGGPNVRVGQLLILP